MTFSQTKGHCMGMMCLPNTTKTLAEMSRSVVNNHPQNTSLQQLPFFLHRHDYQLLF